MGLYGHIYTHHRRREPGGRLLHFGIGFFEVRASALKQVRGQIRWDARAE